MSGVAQSLSIAMLVAASLLSIVAAFGFRYRDRPGARGFALTMGAAAAWTTVLAVNVYPTQFLPGYVSMTFRNGLILLTVLGWAWLAVEHVRRERLSLRPVPTAVVLLIPVLTVLITATNPLHHLAITPGTPSDIGGGPQIDWGPWHLVFMAYVFTVSLSSAGLLLQNLRTAYGVRRQQIVLLLAGFVVGFSGANDYLLTGAVTGIPEYVRLSPFTFLLAGGFWSVALFRHQLFGLDPVSRRAVVETIPDPVVAVGSDGTVVDLNSAAVEDLGMSESTVGSSVEALRSVSPEVVDRYHEGAGDETPVEATVNDKGERHYSIRIESVGDSRAGSIVVFRDVTDAKTYEDKLKTQRDNLQILNKVVRHDIRNKLQIIEGYADLLDEDIDSEHLDTIKRQTDEAIKITVTARDLTKVMLRESSEYVEKNAGQAVEEEVSSLQEAHPEADVTVTELDQASVQADDMLSAVFRNLLENSTLHNDKDEPVVDVSANRVDGIFRVEVADNGPGIPDDRKEKVFGEGEKGLESPGTGMGLYLVQSLVDRYEGDVWAEDNNPEGTVFVVELPLSE